MSVDDQRSTVLPRGLLISMGVVIVAVAGLVGYLLFAGPSRDKRTDIRPATQALQENPLEQARESLAKANDLTTCRTALQQINTYLSDKPDRRPPTLSDDDRKRLELLRLTPDETKEIEGSGYSLLDAHHLDRCFLFHDIVASISVGAVGTAKDGQPIRQAALERAQALFNWVVREVRLVEHQGEPAPVQFIVRRGTGSALERALVFLALLEGLREEEAGLHGCLISVREKADAPPALWACGVLLAGAPDVYLFDPRLGLPLPGKDGKGIATLGEALTDEKVLSQLNAGDARYDVTPAQAGTAEFNLVFTLSALSPRMRHLQEQILPPAVRVNLTEDDPGTLRERWTRSVNRLGAKAPKVVIWTEATGLTRRFLPEAEGGSDQPQRFPLAALRGFTNADDRTVVLLPQRRIFELSLAPWPTFPDQFRDVRRFPYNIGLGQQVREAFVKPFSRAVLEPNQPRDQRLRGRQLQAAEQLVQERDRLQGQERELHTAGPELFERVDRWVQEAIRVYADSLRAQGKSTEEQAEANQRVAELWKSAKAVSVLLSGAIARQRADDVTYLLGQCKHAEAVHQQARLDLRSRAGLTPSAQEIAASRSAWKAAANWWRRHREEYPNSSAGPAARRYLAEAAAQTGDKAQATALLEDVSGPISPLEKTAHLYLARRMKATSK